MFFRDDLVFVCAQTKKHCCRCLNRKNFLEISNGCFSKRLRTATFVIIYLVVFQQYFHFCFSFIERYFQLLQLCQEVLILPFKFCGMSFFIFQCFLKFVVLFCRRCCQLRRQMLHSFLCKIKFCFLALAKLSYLKLLKYKAK